MKIGNTLNQEIAVKVMGWLCVEGEGFYKESPLEGFAFNFEPSENIEDAMKVARKLNLLEEHALHCALVGSGNSKEWLVSKIDNYGTLMNFVSGETPAHAICLAALAIAEIN